VDLFSRLVDVSQCRYLDGEVYIIDVSQSVEHDHPQALEFLRMDIANITAFFRKRGALVMQMKDLFEFVMSNSPESGDFDDKFSEVSFFRLWLNRY
jgi:serine/threonine-protein kinase RIO1